MKPLVATPCHGDKLCLNYVTSVLKLDPRPQFYFASGSLITQIRNECVAKFRDGDWTHLFFIGNLARNPVLQGGEVSESGRRPLLFGI